MNDDKKIVLDWLKERFKERRINGFSSFDVISDLSFEYERLPFEELETTELSHLKAYGELDYTMQFKVLVEFGQWGIAEQNKSRV
ncbi:hypothetical protein [Vagococcus salmoninarum]|uniref:hypothetical protein n=1 Tax=Vagococcus salmoninarum TaxID=2739 RepID=UPI0018828487|nr:hypothetical protein [Vagococcus salmoninarum]MBE9387853.1 hypothetical protein [Vagococcus salmoninarum]